MAPTTGQDVKFLQDLVSRIPREEGFTEILAALHERQPVTIEGTWGSSCALTVAALAEEGPETVLVVVPRIKDLDDFALDLAGFVTEEPLVFPAWEALPQEHTVSDAIFGKRLRVLSELNRETAPKIIVTCMPALLQPVPSQESREEGTRQLSVGEELDLDELLSWLVDQGFERVPAIELAGEFSVHGGIVDIFPPDALDPLRVEFFGDEIESIRRFDADSQRKLEDLTIATLTVISPVDDSVEQTVQQDTSKKNGEPITPQTHSDIGSEQFLENLPENSWVVLAELQEVVDEARLYLGRLEDRGKSQTGLFTIGSTLAKCAEFPLISMAAIAIDRDEHHCRLSVDSIERFIGPKTEVMQELDELLEVDERVLIACHNDGELQRLTEMLEASSESLKNRVSLCVGTIQKGFRLVRDQLIVLSDHELFHRTLLRRPVRKKSKIETRAIDTFLDLSEGDLVVHLTNGIGRYRGMKLLEKEAQIEEHLVIEFRGGIRVYVPVSLIHLIQKYIGSGSVAPPLSTLGSSSWNKKKEKVAEAVTDMASEMLQMQAAREEKPGICYPPDSEWQREFAAAFPYLETDDQLTAIADLKGDMERTRPMDRLICGDVGYGKTEVAMRAVFKAVDGGKQVAVLVPTTVLAEQHHRTFSERMAEFPVSIASMSRFKTKKEQKETLKRMAEGTVDIVIGTHRLVQPDVVFKDLGLLIIDEEQRFGVGHKEMLKRLRMEVDVLTLSATPIPRTLHMSLLGLRDISSLLTPPQDRQAVETRIVRFDKELVRRAIVRELNRSGQIYFVHNRVSDIHRIADQIRAIVPEAKVVVGHGQMKEHELEKAMLAFVSGEADVLVSTTIIESGLDIPNANTMFINNAGSHFGLADLHQLRGRVGRYRHRAYCYLVVDEGKRLTKTATKRLKAIEEYSELGAGFKIAMKDLEIRGAGNILGTEQSGHISSVGYELYCQLLETAVRGLQNLPQRQPHHVAVDLPIAAYFPKEYVPPGRHKVEIYRKLSSIQELHQVDELREEIRDRFGPIPIEAERLLSTKELQLYAWYWRIDSLHIQGRDAVFQYRHVQRIGQLAQKVGRDLRVVDGRRAFWMMDNPEAGNEELLEQLKSVLRPR